MTEKIAENNTSSSSKSNETPPGAVASNVISGHATNFSLSHDGQTLTKKTNHLEKDTYELIQCTLMESITPKFLSASHEGIVIENLLAGFLKPSIVDIKLGYWLYNKGHKDYESPNKNIQDVLRLDPGALTLKERREGAWSSKARFMEWKMRNTLNGTHFFSLNGFKNALIEQKYSNYSKYDFNDENETRMFFTAFFNHNEQLKSFMCDELNRIKTVITGPLFSTADPDCEKSQKSFFCHRTPFQMSLLLAYDISDPENKKVAKLIDFGRTYPNDQVDSQVAAKQQESICEALENIKKLISGSKVNPSAPKPFVDIDFSQVDKEVKQMEDEAAEKDVNAFFAQLYAKSSDETQMAMRKSLLESKGTVLSTDWKDVGSKDVKPYESQD